MMPFCRLSYHYALLFFFAEVEEEVLEEEVPEEDLLLDKDKTEDDKEVLLDKEVARDKENVRNATKSIKDACCRLLFGLFSLMRLGILHIFGGISMSLLCGKDWFKVTTSASTTSLPS